MKRDSSDIPSIHVIVVYLGGYIIKAHLGCHSILMLKAESGFPLHVFCLLKVNFIEKLDEN